MSVRMLVLLIFLFIGSFCIFPVTAHPPGSIDLSFDSDTGMLNVTILHEVSDARDHYIREVTIEVPDKPVQKFDYSSQPDLREFTYSYPVNSPDGTSMKVTAICSKYGSLSQNTRIGTQGSGVVNSSEKSTSIPGFSSFGALLALVCYFGMISLRE